jgi:hypothetical protein
MNRHMAFLGNADREASQPRPTECQCPLLQTPGMDLSKMTRQEIEALLKLLAEWERRELMLLMLERREAERAGRLH